MSQTLLAVVCLHTSNLTSSNLMVTVWKQTTSYKLSIHPHYYATSIVL